MTTLPADLQHELAAGTRGWHEPEVRDELRRLRRVRDFRQLATLAERAARFAPEVAELRRLQAQALIETGELATALDVIAAARARVDDGDPEAAELDGLQGRALKQMFVDSGDGDSPAARALLDRAITAYRRTHTAKPGSYWHGANVVALEQRRGASALADGPLAALARQVDAAAALHASTSGDPWALATRVEMAIALGDFAGAEGALGRFLGAGDVDSFHVASLLRQLVQVWRLDRRGGDGAGMLSALRARHAMEPGPDPSLLGAADVRAELQGIDARRTQFERILGAEAGLATYEWWQRALVAATCIASVRDASGRRIGTAFLVEGGALLPKWAGRRLALTNYHVVNRAGAARAVPPDDAELVFEAVDANTRHRVRTILWESPAEQFDCTVLLLDPEPAAAGTVSLARVLPLLRDDTPTSVFIIGHPDGRGLEFSISDNRLLAHDGDAGHPVTRLHYRAPTEGGSSGSPVFRAGRWEVLAIHHGWCPTPLDGCRGRYSEANEGIGLQSIRAALAMDEAALPDLAAP